MHASLFVLFVQLMETNKPRWNHRGYGEIWTNDAELLGKEPPYFWENPEAHPFARRRVPQLARERHERMMARIRDRIAALSRK